MDGKDCGMQINFKTYAIQMRPQIHGVQHKSPILGALVVFELLNSVPVHFPPLEVLSLNELALPCFYSNGLIFCSGTQGSEIPLEMSSELGYLQILLLQNFLVSV